MKAESIVAKTQSNKAIIRFSPDLRRDYLSPEGTTHDTQGECQLANERLAGLVSPTTVCRRSRKQIPAPRRVQFQASSGSYEPGLLRVRHRALLKAGACAPRERATSRTAPSVNCENRSVQKRKSPDDCVA